jgi:hypothetical protein
MYTDAKSRIKEDNFLEYLAVEMNLAVPFRKGQTPRRVLKKVEPWHLRSWSSQTEDVSASRLAFYIRESHQPVNNAFARAVETGAPQLLWG